MESKKLSEVDSTINKSTNNDFFDFRDEKSKKKKLVIGLSIIGVIIIVVLGTILFVKGNYNAQKFLDKNIKLINNKFDDVIDALNLDNIKNNEEPITNFGKIKFETNSIELKDLNNIALEYKINSVLKDKYVDYDFTLSQLEQASININGLINDTKIYFTSKELIDKNYFYDLTDVQKSFNEENNYKIIEQLTNEDNIKYIVSSLLNKINNSLKKSTITTKYDKLNVIYTYEVNDSNKDLVNDNLIKEIKNDSKLIKLLNITDEDIDNLDNVIDNFKLEITINMFTNNIKEFTITTADEKLVGTQIDNNKLKITSSTSDDYIELEYSEKMLGITLYENSKSTDQFLIETKKDEININYSYDEYLFEANITKENIKMSYKTNDMNISLDFKITGDKDKNIDGQINLDKDNENIKLIINNTITYKNNFEKKQMNNAININDISNEDLNEIISNGFTILGKFDAINIISNITF